MVSKKRVFKDVWAKNVSALMDENGDFGEEIQLYVYGMETSTGIEMYFFSDGLSAAECYWNSMKNGEKCYELYSVAKHIRKEQLSEKNKVISELQLEMQQKYIESFLLKVPFPTIKIREKQEFMHNQVYWISLCWLKRMQGELTKAECQENIMKQNFPETMDWTNHLQGQCFGFGYCEQEEWKLFYNGDFFQTLVNWLNKIGKGYDVTPLYGKKYNERQTYKSLEKFKNELKNIV